MENTSWNSLLIQTVSDPGSLTLFDASDRTVIAEGTVSIKWREFDLFLPSLEDFLGKHGKSTKDLENIVLVNGPASFTGGRITSLTVNTLALVNGTKLFPIDFFEYCRLGGNAFPMILEANKSECIIKQDAGTQMRLVAIDEVPVGEYAWFVTLPDFAEREIRVQSCINTASLVRNLDLTLPRKRIETLYLKHPNITFSSKHHGTTGPSHT